ncbi:protein-S-isoprenylcysteine O-methyltransferase [Chloroflexota bacterium]
MNELTIKIIFMVLYVIAAATRAPYAQKVKKFKVKTSKRKVIEILLMFPIALGLMILPLFYVFSDWLNSFNMDLPVWLRIIGVIGFAFAVFMHGWSHVALKTNWSPLLEIKEEQKLITTGPYKYIRHPMYTAFWLWAIFQGISLSNWLVLAIGILSFGIMYFARVKHEEQLMIEEFGEEYKAYMKKTGRLFPKII